MLSTDKAWKYFGETNPYYGVLTNEAFDKERLDDVARAKFFQSGEEYVAYALSVVRGQLDADFTPIRVLDFGCGVGRLTIPLARRSDDAVGVDVSEGMLREAEANAAGAGVRNVRFELSDDSLSSASGFFNLVHSFIVFQHIVPHRGHLLLRRLIDKLQDGGVGILHVTYANASDTPRIRRAVTSAYERIPFTYALRNLAKGKPMREPMMHMNRYQLSDVLRTLQEAGCHDVHVRFTEASHYGWPIYGAIVFFKKQAMDVSLHS